MFLKLVMDCLYLPDLDSPRIALYFSKSRPSKTLLNIFLSLSITFFGDMLDVSGNTF